MQANHEWRCLYRHPGEETTITRQQWCNGLIHVRRNVETGGTNWKYERDKTTDCNCLKEPYFPTDIQQAIEEDTRRRELELTARINQSL
ncbi:MAG TPA: hypothetical protein VJI73_01400 [Candidatus Paceibacterota bacterium]